MISYTSPVLFEMGTIVDITADKAQGPNDGFNCDIAFSSVPPELAPGHDTFPQGIK